MKKNYVAIFFYNLIKKVTKNCNLSGGIFVYYNRDENRRIHNKDITAKRQPVAGCFQDYGKCSMFRTDRSGGHAEGVGRTGCLDRHRGSPFLLPDGYTEYCVENN